MRATDYPAMFLVEVTDPGQLPYANLGPALNMSLAGFGAKCTVTDVSDPQPANQWTFGVGRWPNYETTITVKAPHYPAAWDQAQEELDQRNQDSLPGGWILELLTAR